VTELDARVLVALYGEHPSGPWVMVMAALSLVGGGWAATALVPMIALGRTRVVALHLAAVVVTQATVVVLLKQLVRRPRPCASIAGVHALVFHAPTDPSFPSGHAAGAFSVAAFFALVALAQGRDAKHPLSRRRARVIAAALFATAASIALSRVVLGVHFPIDVSAGAALGTAIGALGARLYVRRVALAA
jgi:undecaprenyl-diphosphatase